MCGRFNQKTTPAEWLKHFQSVLPLVEAEFETLDELLATPNFNVAPTDHITMLREQEGLQLSPAKWGLLPSWSKDAKAGARMINARAETVAEKPAFRTAFKKKRCIVPVDSFYEWRKDQGKKTPFNIYRTDGAPLNLAGLWETWKDPNDPSDTWLVTATVITTTPNSEMAQVHDRMPVIVEDDDIEQWVCGDTTDAAELMHPATNGTLTMTEIGSLVGNPRNKGPEVLEGPNPQLFE